MESIFESLENLNVSEECFEDIIGLVQKQLNESIFTAINKYVHDPAKRALLTDKAADIKGKALDQIGRGTGGVKRGGRDSKHSESDRPIGMRTDIDTVDPKKTLGKTYKKAAQERRNAEYASMLKSAIRNAKKNGKSPYSVWDPTGFFGTPTEDKIWDYVTKNYKANKFKPAD